MKFKMRRRQFLSSLASAPLAAAPARPNIILIDADDQRFDTIHALGNPDIRTPNLDRLAGRGMAFTNVYSQGGMIGALCLPSRTMLMTGRSVFHIPAPSDRSGNYPLLAKTMERAGYSTFHMGKPGNTFRPAGEAFQKTLYTDESKDGAVRAQQSQLSADAVIEFLHEMLAPHPRTPEAMRRHIADYYACITCLDHHIGRVLAAAGLANTIVLFTGDQGLAVGGRHGLMGKQNLYEHFKSPLLIAGPGVRHGRSDALVYMHDLFPTLCGLAGVDVPEGVEGASLAGICRGGGKPVREHLFAVYKDCQRMVRDSRFKLIWYPKIGRFQLFDLAADPWELEDLSAKPAHAAKLADMKKQLAAGQDRFDDRFAPRPTV